MTMLQKFERAGEVRHNHIYSDEDLKLLIEVYGSMICFFDQSDVTIEFGAVLSRHLRREYDRFCSYREARKNL